jgi:hypothetical protein
MNNLNQYKNITESTDTLISLLVYDKKVIDLITFLENELEKAKKISNPIKKHKVNNRVFNLIKFLNDNYAEDSDCTINSIFLVHDKIIENKLTNEDINNAKYFKFYNIQIYCETLFKIDYFIDLFYNFNFIYSIKLNKNDYNISKFNKNKEKEIENSKISNEDKITELVDNIRKNNNYKELIIIYGKSPIISKLENKTESKSESKIKNTVLYNDFLNREALYNLYENEIMKKNHLLLKEKIESLNNEKTNVDLYIFGKLKFEIKDSIESYLIKELYIEDKKLDKLKTFVDESFFNFKIIPIKSLEDGDVAYNFIKDYNGIMGIKYY